MAPQHCSSFQCNDTWKEFSFFATKVSQGPKVLSVHISERLHVSKATVISFEHFIVASQPVWIRVGRRTIFLTWNWVRQRKNPWDSSPFLDNVPWQQSDPGSEEAFCVHNNLMRSWRLWSPARISLGNLFTRWLLWVNLSLNPHESLQHLWEVNMKANQIISST